MDFHLHYDCDGWVTTERPWIEWKIFPNNLILKQPKEDCNNMICDDKNKGMCQNRLTKTSNMKKSPTPCGDSGL